MIRLIQSQDPDTLNFRQDLSHIADAALLSASGMLADLSMLEQQLGSAQRVLDLSESAHAAETRCDPKAAAEDMPCEDDVSSLCFPEFLRIASTQLASARAEVSRMQHKYTDILTYFGEDPELSSGDFFKTLNLFGVSFSQAMTEVGGKRRELEGAAPWLNYQCVFSGERSGTTGSDAGTSVRRSRSTSAIT